MTMVLDEVVGRETRHVLQTYRRQPVTFVRGQGVRLWDADGRDRAALETAALAETAANTTRLIGEPAGAQETGR